MENDGLKIFLWKSQISRKFWVRFGWYSQSTSQTIQRSLGLPRDAFWKNRKNVLLATKSPSDTENDEKWKKSKILKSIINENASFSGSNNVDFCSQIFWLSTKQFRKIQKLILHKTWHIMMATMNKYLRK